MTKETNKNFIIVFQPKDRTAYGGKRRFAVGAGRLAEYVGEKNANTALSQALISLEDKYTLKLRKFGRIDFYVK